MAFRGPALLVITTRWVIPNYRVLTALINVAEPTLPTSLLVQHSHSDSPTPSTHQQGGYKGTSNYGAVRILLPIATSWTDFGVRRR